MAVTPTGGGLFGDRLDQAKGSIGRNRMTGMLDDVRTRLGNMVQEDPEQGIYRAGPLRSGDEAHLRGQLDLSRPREPAAGQQRLPDDVDGPAAGHRVADPRR